MLEHSRLSRRLFSRKVAATVGLIGLAPQEILAATRKPPAPKKRPERRPVIKTLIDSEISDLYISGDFDWGGQLGGVSWEMTSLPFEPVSGELILVGPGSKGQRSFELPKSPQNGLLLRGLCLFAGLLEAEDNRLALPHYQFSRRRGQPPMRGGLSVYSGEQGVSPYHRYWRDSPHDVHRRGLSVASASTTGSGVLGRWQASFRLVDSQGGEHFSNTATFWVRR